MVQVCWRWRCRLQSIHRDSCSIWRQYLVVVVTTVVEDDVVVVWSIITCCEGGRRRRSGGGAYGLAKLSAKEDPPPSA